MTMYVDKINLSAYASEIGIKEQLKISAEARVKSEGIVTYVELFAWR